MDTLTAELSPSILAEVLQEPEKALLGRVLKTLGQERCAANSNLCLIARCQVAYNV